MALRGGTTLSESLRLDRRLGAGAMGEVWRAHHRRLGRDVAVKVITDAVRGKRTVTERFFREARAAASVRSPHVVAVFEQDWAELDGESVPYIAMELVEGQDLEALLAERGALPVDLTVELVRQACAGLAAAHAAGVVHRDIKPSNLLLSTRGDRPHLTIVDFGVAKLLGDDATKLTRTGAMVGTPAFMAPEQLLGDERIDERADAWAIAVVAYACLTGRHPFSASSEVALYAAMKGPRTPATAHRRLPPAVDAFFERAFRVAPQERFGDVAELARSFEAALASDGASGGVDPHAPTEVAPSAGAPTLEPVPAPAPDGPRGVPRWVWAVSAIAALGAAVVAAVAVAIASGRFGDSGGVGPGRPATEAPAARREPPRPRAPSGLVRVKVAVPDPRRAEITAVLRQALADAEERHPGFVLTGVYAEEVADGVVDLEAGRLSVEMKDPTGAERRSAHYGADGGALAASTIVAGGWRATDHRLVVPRCASDDAWRSARGAGFRAARANLVLRQLDGAGAPQVWQLLPSDDASARPLWIHAATCAPVTP